jgi:hypothetical protein
VLTGLWGGIAIGAGSAAAVVASAILATGIAGATVGAVDCGVPQPTMKIKDIERMRIALIRSILIISI